jgi:hypothetical protein
MTMATTLTNVQAGIAYRQTQDDIRRTLAALAAHLHTHATEAAADGTDWGHVDDLTAILEGLACLTPQQ